MSNTSATRSVARGVRPTTDGTSGQQPNDSPGVDRTLRRPYPQVNNTGSPVGRGTTGVASVRPGGQPGVSNRPIPSRAPNPTAAATNPNLNPNPSPNPNTQSIGSPNGPLRNRTGTGAAAISEPADGSQPPRVGGAVGSRIGARAPVGQRGPASSTSQALGRTLPSRTSTAGVLGRRPSQLVVEKEKKTDYWRDVAQVATQDGTKLGGEELNSVISRAMALGIVGDKKQRESVSGPKAQELLGKMKESMEQRLVELNNGKPIDVDALTSQNATLMDKVLGLERTLAALEARKSNEENEEKAKLQNKIGELERSLRSLEASKREQREQNRRTMKLEIANLKEMMAKVQNQKETESAASNEAKQMSQKMNRLEAALRLMNEERKKGAVEDKETIVLRRKLALFEQKLTEMEEEKKIRESADQSGQLRDKLLLMEDKLEKMERRKSMSMTMHMQQKMDAVEKQLSMLRSMGGNAKDSGDLAAKMTALERQLKELATQKAMAPKMVNDEETVAMRNHIRKLEESLLSAEKRMEEQRNKIEEERRHAYEERLKKDEETRRKQKEIEQQLFQRISDMEQKLLNAPQGGGGGGGGGGAGAGGDNPELVKKLHEMEMKMKQMQDSNAYAKSFTSTPAEGGGGGGEINIMMILNKIKSLEEQNKAMEIKIASGGGGGGGHVSKSGLSYAEITQKLQEIQAQIMQEGIEERESERLNIEYSKLMDELEETPEYKKEQADLVEKWRTENIPLNKASFEKVFGFLSSIPEAKRLQVLKRKPELSLLLRPQEEVGKLHESNFLQYSTQNLNLDEARALFHHMPKFRKEQEKQCRWSESLKAKIEVEAAKPPKKAPPPIAPKKKVVIKKKAGGGGGGSASFLDELLKKRKKRD